MFLVIGISINFIIYMIINVGYVIKLLPTTGLALPFISYGGSHTMVNFIMVGLLFNVSKVVKKHEL
jgi:cell division protein FtsW (lipid II flippase)